MTAGVTWKTVFPSVSIIIPIVRPEKATRCIDALLAGGSNVKLENGSITALIDGYPCEILTEIDTDHIGAPLMVKRLTGRTLADCVMFLGDDTIPQRGIIGASMGAMSMFPDGWGLVALNDGIWNGTMPTHWLAHKKLLPYCEGEFFSTAYAHCFCDNELKDIAIEIDRYTYAPEAVLIHDHPHVTHEGYDEHYKRAYLMETFMADQRTFWRRKIARHGERLAIGLPLTGHFRDDDFWLSLLAMEKPMDLRIYTPEIGVGEFGRDIAILRNSLVHQALSDGYSHLVLFDTDQDFPDDTLHKVWSHHSKAAVVLGPVHRRYPPFELILFRGEPDKYLSVPDEEKYSGGLIDIDAGGSGCMLLDLRHIVEIPYPWFELRETPAGKPLGEDIGLCAKIRARGGQIVADTSIVIDHLARVRINREFHEVYSRLNGSAPKACHPVNTEH
jgi:hypothetical protein